MSNNIIYLASTKNFQILCYFIITKVLRLFHVKNDKWNVTKYHKAEGRDQPKCHVTLCKMAQILYLFNFFRLFHRQKLRKTRIAFVSTGQKLQHLLGYFTWFADSLISHQCQFALLPPTRNFNIKWIHSLVIGFKNSPWPNLMKVLSA